MVPIRALDRVNTSSHQFTHIPNTAGLSIHGWHEAPKEVPDQAPEEALKEACCVYVYGDAYLKCYAHPPGPSVPRFFVSLCLGLLLS